MTEPEARGRFVVEHGIEWYRIDDVDLLDPFLVTVVTPDDHWIYVSTSGALTAGRGRADNALFPYETDDRLHRSGGRVGPLTVIRTVGQGEVWEPFAPHAPLGTVRRSVAKTAVGDRFRFDEHHPGLGLTFSYTWTSAGSFGLVRSCQLVADQHRPAIEIELLDGLIDVLPAGVELAAQQTSSTLVDAYRRSELDSDSGLALFTLEALISDRADPAECLHANAVWSRGLDGATVALSDRQVRRFRSGLPIEPEHLVTGAKGAFFQSTAATVDASKPLRWIVVADVEQDHLAVAHLRRRLIEGPDPEAEVRAEIDRAHTGLVSIVAEADGLQETADRSATIHHFANVLFNSMRGGSFLDDHRVEVADVDRFVATRNRIVHPRFRTVAAGLDPLVELDALRRVVADDADLSRLVNEYLPLTFSRRHGDPSRPWNTFHIPPPSAEGHPARGYEGNWRDIFQNWEALVHSYPSYIESVVAKFLNASTIDGHNPYRITNDGLDWEQPEDGSWANFGYWGDHQIVYLHQLLDAAHRFQPGLLESMLDRRAFSYADVPYRILPYDSLVRDPKATLEFDGERQRRVDDRVRTTGADGQLVPATTEDGVHLASLAEKLFVPALAKLSNLVAGGGIWMNTQRPEWNDANNALVGNGVSVVTLFHLRHYLEFIDGVLIRSSVTDVRIGQPVVEWLAQLQAGLEAHEDLHDTERITPVRRRQLLDTLGRAFSEYRSTVYSHGPGPSSPVAVTVLRRFLSVVRPHLDAAVSAAQRPDGLVHAYWLLHLDPGEARLEPLYPMLEGQVAALDSFTTDLGTTLGVVETLFTSDLYRPDQQSLLLYPNRPPP
ncbi:MAG: hypothetical protein OEV40_27510, partial [Acidimicrobiia bacterium]|nr:hypothetical protein [Acidimicrobiia bacterium]